MVFFWKCTRTQVKLKTKQLSFQNIKLTYETYPENHFILILYLFIEVLDIFTIELFTKNNSLLVKLTFDY